MSDTPEQEAPAPKKKGGKLKKLLLLLIALLRLLAWLLHGAALTPDAIALEVIVAGLLLFASSRLTTDR